MDMSLIQDASDGASVKQRHPKYYIELVLFEVEDTLFRVQRDGFIRANPKFFDQFSLWSGEESSPIKLEDITAQAFEHLLMVLYPIGKDTPTYAEWLGVLYLATRWNMFEIRKEAFEALAALNEDNPRPIAEIIQLAQQYRIKRWLRQSYITLVQQKGLQLDALLLYLDPKTIMRIFAARTHLLERQPAVFVTDGKCNNCDKEDDWHTCMHCCFKKEQPHVFCSNCRATKAYWYCERYCRNRITPIALDDYSIVEAEVDKIFYEEFLEMEGLTIEM
ncbi:hypothetical protein CPB83DRAFT_896164 [Crepidotus variabilis]|uniref:BTB domain-containing protein n=1 Tax=Crepidotus variabilis TaxID=179855 RepID=A0A9P6ECL0_9AGAR|nr:hypothetical protein CPB83DRAFT_896164 [Crepidotus variabilis]